MPKTIDDGRINDRDWLRGKYHEDGLTQREIAEVIGCSRHTVMRRMDSFGIQTIIGGREGPPAEERFWEKVDRGDPDECWEWKAATDEHGYGVFSVTTGEQWQAHRYAYKMEIGPPKERYVLHHCDNPPCVNTNHLYVGDQADNVSDALERERMPVGEDAPNAKLTKSDVQDIHDKLNKGHDRREIADEYGVTRGTIGDIAVGKSWSRVGIENPYYENHDIESNSEKLTDEDVAEIKRLLNEGVVQRRIADRFQINPSVVSRINCGHRYEYIEPSK